MLMVPMQPGSGECKGCRGLVVVFGPGVVCVSPVLLLYTLSVCYAPCKMNDTGQRSSRASAAKVACRRTVVSGGLCFFASLCWGPPFCMFGPVYGEQPGCQAVLH